MAGKPFVYMCVKITGYKGKFFYMLYEKIFVTSLPTPPLANNFGEK